MIKILIINIGSTSTKLALFLDCDALFRESVEHSSENLSRLRGYDEWFRFHNDVVKRVLHERTRDLDGLGLVVSRGGLTRPIQGGAYYINDAMLRDLRSEDYGWHPCNIGPCIA